MEKLLPKYIGIGRILEQSGLQFDQLMQIWEQNRKEITLYFRGNVFDDDFAPYGTKCAFCGFAAGSSLARFDYGFASGAVDPSQCTDWHYTKVIEMVVFSDYNEVGEIGKHISVYPDNDAVMPFCYEMPANLEKHLFLKVEDADMIAGFVKNPTGQLIEVEKTYGVDRSKAIEVREIKSVAKKTGTIESDSMAMVIRVIQSFNDKPTIEQVRKRGKLDGYYGDDFPNSYNTVKKAYDAWFDSEKVFK